MNTAIAIAAALAALYFLWDKIGSFILNKKSAEISQKVETQKEIANEAVIKANVSRESFLDKLRKYRSKG